MAKKHAAEVTTTTAQVEAVATTPATTEKKEVQACGITREQFRANAKPIMVTIDGRQMVATAKEFATGSLGWYLGGNEKVIIVIDGVPCKVQIGLNLTIAGSKQLS